VGFEVALRGFGRAIGREVDADAIVLLAAPIAAHERGIERTGRNTSGRAPAVTHDDAIQIRTLPFAIVGMPRVMLRPERPRLDQRIRAVAPILAHALGVAPATAIAALACQRRQGSRNQHRELAGKTRAELEHIEAIRPLIIRRWSRNASWLARAFGWSSALCRLLATREDENE
jgi:hypothetical protein